MSSETKYKVILPESDFGTSNHCYGISGNSKIQVVQNAMKHWFAQTFDYYTGEMKAHYDEEYLDKHFKISLDEGFLFQKLPMVEGSNNG